MNLHPRERFSFAAEIDVHPSKIEAWVTRSLADGSTFPAWAIPLLPRRVREGLLQMLSTFGDAVDRGDL